jgi:hypothetical protein
VDQVHEAAVVRAAEVVGVAYVTQAALRAVTELTVTEEELSKLSPSARLRMAAIGDAGTAAIQARILDLMDGL